MKLIITETFRKNLEKIGSIDLSTIEKESRKYQSGLKNFIELYTFADGKVLK